MKILLLGIGFLATFCNCKHQQSRNSPNKSAYFNAAELGAYNKDINVRISARFNECGEWGGHEEEIILTADQSENFFAEYHVFPFNCDSLVRRIHPRNTIPTVSKKIKLNENNKEAILRFLHKMTDAIISEEFPSHADNRFTFANADSSLFISVLTSKESDIKGYKDLVEYLFKNYR